MNFLAFTQLNSTQFKRIILIMYLIYSKSVFYEGGIHILRNTLSGKRGGGRGFCIELVQINAL